MSVISWPIDNDEPAKTIPIYAIELRGESSGAWSVFCYTDGRLEHRRRFDNLYLAMSYARGMNDNLDGVYDHGTMRWINTV